MSRRSLLLRNRSLNLALSIREARESFLYDEAFSVMRNFVCHPSPRSGAQAFALCLAD